MLIPISGRNADGTYKEQNEQGEPDSWQRFDFVAYGDLRTALNRFEQQNFKKLKVSSDGQEISISGSNSDPSSRMQKT